MILKLQTKDVSDIFLCFWLIKKIRKAMIYTSSMLGDLQTPHKRSHPKAKGTKMLKILEAMQMQCYDAMRDIRVKIGVLHHHGKRKN